MKRCENFHNYFFSFFSGCFMLVARGVADWSVNPAGVKWRSLAVSVLAELGHEGEFPCFKSGKESVQ